MIACTSPGFTCSERPLRISRPTTRTCRFSMFNMWSVLTFARVRGVAVRSADRAFEADFEQFLGFDRKFHRQLAEHLLAEAIDDQRYGIFLGDAARPAVEQLVVGYFRGGRFMLDGRRRMLDLDVRERV